MNDINKVRAGFGIPVRQLEANRLNHLGIELDRKHRWDEATFEFGVIDVGGCLVILFVGCISAVIRYT